MAITYRVERSDDGLTGWSTVASGIATLSTVLTSQPVNTQKYYKVFRVIDGLYDEAFSNVLAVLILSVPVLSISGGVGADHLRLTWTSTSATSYNLYKYREQTGLFHLIANTNGLSYNDYDIALNEYEYYYVTAVSSDGFETIPSNVVSGRIESGGIFSMGNSRGTVHQGIQLGFESTGGTLVPATKRLIGIEIMQTPNKPVKVVKYDGAKGASGTQKGLEHTEAKFNGVMDFNLLPYLARLGWGTGVTPVTANGGTTYRWIPSSIDPITPSSATIEQGSSQGAEKFGYATLMDLGFKWSKEDASIEGAFFGTDQGREAVMTNNLRMVVSANAAGGATSLSVDVTKADGSSANGLVIPAGTYYIESPYVSQLGTAAFVTFTSTGPETVSAGAATLTVTALAVGINAGAVSFTVREVPAVHMDPKSIGVFLSTNGVDYTVLEDPIDGALNLNGLFKPSFHQNDGATDSFDRIVELNPNINATITVEEGSEANTFMGYLENGQKVWLGLKCTGSTINASPLVKHLFKLNVPMFITKPDPGDKDGVYGNTFTFDHAHDQAFGQFDLTVINRIPAL